MKGIYHPDTEEMKTEINSYMVLLDKKNFATQLKYVHVY
jgi:hypothetical protein